jgi:hypothetical protein
MFTSALSRRVVLAAGVFGLLVSSLPMAQAEERLFGNTRDAKKGFDILGGNTQDRKLQGIPGQKVPPDTIPQKTPIKPAKPLSPGAQAQLKKFAADADAASKLGHDAYVKGALAQAIDNDLKSLELRERYFAETDQKIPTIAHELGDAYAKQNANGDAIEALNKALKYYSKFYGPGTEHRIPTLLVLAELYKKKNDMPRAYNAYKEAYLIEDRAKGKSAAQTMQMRMTVARLARELTLNQEAADLYKETVDISEGTPGSLQHDVYVAALTEYGDVLTKLNQAAEAKKVLAKAEAARNAAPSSAASAGDKPPQ